MYHKKTHPVVKEVVEREFCKVDGSVRVVFCAIAFGMGVNVEGAYLALHLGPSSCLDDYLQEVGRIGPVTNKVMLYSLPSVDVQEAKTSAVR